MPGHRLLRQRLQRDAGEHSQEVGINVGETSEDGRFTLEAVRCLGACGLAPVMLIGEDTHGNINPTDTVKILEGYQ